MTPLLPERPLPTIAEIAEIAGISPSGAGKRLRRYLRGELTRERLVQPRKNRGRRPGAFRERLEVQARLDAIPGGTNWERANIPDRPDPRESCLAENRMLVEEIQRRTGVHRETARQRVHYWRKTKDCPREYLFRPEQPRGGNSRMRQVAPVESPPPPAEPTTTRGPCPLTNGRPTRMTEQGFLRACEQRRSAPPAEHDSFRIGRMNGHFRKRCETCAGERENWPAELVIVELETMMTTQTTGAPASIGIPVPDADAPGRGSLARPERETSARGGPPLPDEKPGNRGHISTHPKHEEEHAMAKEKIGVCDICGQKAQTRNAHGVNHACPTCVKIVGLVVNHGERVATAARMTGKNVDLALAMGLSDGAPTASEGAAQSQSEAAAWRMLMDEVERHGLVKVTATEPEAMIRQFMESATAPADELAALKKHAAELLGCPQDEIVPALRLTEATLRTIREVVEPELEGEEYGSLPEACRLLVARYHAVRDAEHDAAEDEARTVELETRLMEAEREQDRLRERLRERLKTGADPTEDALLQWAIRKYQAGKITLQIEVQEMEAAA